MFGLNDSQNDNQPKAGEKPAEPAAGPFDEAAPADKAGQPAPPAQKEPATPPPADTPAPANDDLLIDLKEQALNDLSPLVSHLDQSPEEQFKTLMMLIQAADNSSLIKDAYQAAKNIPDEKSRAQALLDIVNEINYFTQKEDTEKD